MAVAKEADQHSLNQFLLANDDLSNFIDQRLKGDAAFLDFRREFGNSFMQRNA
jgi:hypothetical protein